MRSQKITTLNKQKIHALPRYPGQREKSFQFLLPKTILLVIEIHVSTFKNCINLFFLSLLALVWTQRLAGEEKRLALR